MVLTKRVCTTVALGLVALGACGASDLDSSTTPSDEMGAAGGQAVADQSGSGQTGSDQTVEAIVIDVRTPEEFATGHLDGAVNIDVQSPAFDAALAELDVNATYVVYCRSGNRSAAAVDRMTELGFVDTVNAGSLQSASEFTGLTIVG